MVELTWRELKAIAGTEKIVRLTIDKANGSSTSMKPYDSAEVVIYAMENDRRLFCCPRWNILRRDLQTTLFLEEDMNENAIDFQHQSIRRGLLRYRLYDRPRISQERRMLTIEDVLTSAKNGKEILLLRYPVSDRCHETYCVKPITRQHTEDLIYVEFVLHDGRILGHCHITNPILGDPFFHDVPGVCDYMAYDKSGNSSVPDDPIGVNSNSLRDDIFRRIFGE